MAAPVGVRGWQHNLLICFAGCSKGYFSWGARTPIYNLLICFAGATDGCASPSGATRFKAQGAQPCKGDQTLGSRANKNQEPYRGDPYHRWG